MYLYLAKVGQKGLKNIQQLWLLLYCYNSSDVTLSWIDTHRQSIYNEFMSVDYFEDIKLHQKYRSRGYILTEEEIVSFAAQWDPQPMHMDPDYAKNSEFGSVMAAGTHLSAICTKLNNERKPKLAYRPSPGWDKVRFLTPARPGDVLVSETEAIRKRRSESRSDIGIVIFFDRLLNQHDEPVLTRERIIFLTRRP